MAGYQVKPLDKETWPDFASLAERHNGVWGGCWCLEFHPEGSQKGVDRRALKEQRVNDGQAHAALVFDGDLCVGWCQFGSPDELPRIKFGRAYREDAAEPPDWRITCFFVDKAYRHKGVAAAALKGALREIARLGGERWRALRRTPRGARSLAHSCTTPTWLCSRSKGSNAPGNSERTAGW